MKLSMWFSCLWLGLIFQSYCVAAESSKLNGFVTQGITQAKKSNFVTDDGHVLF
jgi:hypothetical protein